MPAENHRQSKPDFAIKQVLPSDRAWVLSLKDKYFSGADFIVTRGRKVYPADLPGYYAETTAGERIGFLGYEVIDGDCEVVTLDASLKFGGVGTALMNALIDEARAQGWRKIWLITTNDNLEALRFYQRRGFVIRAVHVNAVENSRTQKPTIPLVGNFGIRIRDEIELEFRISEP